MMPDAEPRAGTTIGSRAPIAAGSEIVDLTDAALDDPTAAERGDEPDAATTTDRVPADGRRRCRPTAATASARWARSCSSRWWCWERRR